MVNRHASRYLTPCLLPYLTFSIYSHSYQPVTHALVPLILDNSFTIKRLRALFLAMGGGVSP